ncbi:hypothetical protein GCM10023321_73160 [Pseudonocardia eucalypti]|uniref:Uncharacterized protein n=1 Tax=Pseudonocardia eucalypti TaxID=648755 RepID=A0ABP9R832_9PSEU
MLEPSRSARLTSAARSFGIDSVGTRMRYADSAGSGLTGSGLTGPGFSEAVALARSAPEISRTAATATAAPTRRTGPAPTHRGRPGHTAAMPTVPPTMLGPSVTSAAASNAPRTAPPNTTSTTWATAWSRRPVRGVVSLEIVLARNHRAGDDPTRITNAITATPADTHSTAGPNHSARAPPANAPNPAWVNSRLVLSPMPVS